jgi:hypothetical protein
MMEKFRVPALFIALSGVLPTYAYNVNTGIIVDIGDGVTQSILFNPNQEFSNKSIVKSITNKQKKRTIFDLFVNDFFEEERIEL